MIYLETLFEEISNLQDIRYIQQKEKIEQLQDEILHLKNLIIAPANKDDSSNGTTTKLHQISEIICIIINYI